MYFGVYFGAQRGFVFCRGAGDYSVNFSNLMCSSSFKATVLQSKPGREQHA